MCWKPYPLLTPGRGLRNAKTTEIGRKTADGQLRRWGVAAVVNGPGGESVLGVGCDPATQGERRKVQVDGAPARGQAALAERFSALWLTPQMDRLFIDGAEERRRYLDRLAATFDPAHIGRVSNYRNAMRQRLSAAEGRPCGPNLAGRVGGRDGRSRCRRRRRPE